MIQNKIKIYLLIATIIISNTINQAAEKFDIYSEYFIPGQPLSQFQEWTYIDQQENFFSCYNGLILGRLQEGYVYQTFVINQPHFKVGITFTLLYLYEINSGIDYAYIYIDGNSILLLDLNTYGYGIQNNNMCSQQSSSINNDQFLINYGIEQLHNSQLMEVKFYTNLNSALPNIESYGIQNLRIYVSTCHTSCKSCDGPLENDCLSCPINSSLSGGICQCNDSKVFFQHECIENCPNGFVLQNYSCLKICEVRNCFNCSNENAEICVICDTGYYLIYGQCLKYCPIYNILQNGVCIDKKLLEINKSSETQVITDLMSDEFNHFEVIQEGWYYSLESPQLSSYSSSSCQNRKLLLGFGSSYYNTYSSSQYIQKTFTNLPSHYYIRVRATVYLGDKWNIGEYIKLGTGSTEDIYTISSVSSEDLGCGGPQQYGDRIVTLDSGLISHTSSTYTFKIEWKALYGSYSQWIGFREISILLQQKNLLCQIYVGSQFNECFQCIGVANQSKSREVNNFCKCPSGFYDNYPQQDDCQSCPAECPNCVSSTICSMNCSQKCGNLGCDHQDKCNNCQDQYYLESGSCIMNTNLKIVINKNLQFMNISKNVIFYVQLVHNLDTVILIVMNFVETKVVIQMAFAKIVKHFLHFLKEFASLRKIVFITKAVFVQIVQRDIFWIHRIINAHYVHQNVLVVIKIFNVYYIVILIAKVDAIQMVHALIVQENIIWQMVNASNVQIVVDHQDVTAQLHVIIVYLDIIQIHKFAINVIQNAQNAKILQIIVQFVKTILMEKENCQNVNVNKIMQNLIYNALNVQIVADLQDVITLIRAIIVYLDIIQINIHKLAYHVLENVRNVKYLQITVQYVLIIVITREIYPNVNANKIILKQA